MTILFSDLVQTPESKALRYAFLSDRAAGKPPTAIPGSVERSVTSVGIVGAGTMGSGIAICCLDAGLPTTLIDATPPAVAAGRARIEAYYEQLKKKGRLEATAIDERMQRLATADGYASLSKCDLVIEAVYEDMSLKQEVFRELDRVLVDLGVLPWRIDTVLEDWGMAMGPFAVMDLAGGDIGWAIRKRRQVQQPDRPYSRFPDRVCDLKRFGRKTGAGYYAYDSNGRRSEDPEITQLATEHARAIGRMRSDVSDAEIVERCIFALINEGTKLLDEGITERASDIDVVYRNGYGFPAHRGGPLYFADSLGLDHILRSMATFRAGYEGWFWEPAPRLIDAARHGVRLTNT
jgi:3-hydroxyacyl-CoA dehydrogenase